MWSCSWPLCWLSSALGSPYLPWEGAQINCNWADTPDCFLLLIVVGDKDTKVQTMAGKLIGRRPPRWMLSVISLQRLQRFFGLVFFGWPSALHSLVVLRLGSPVCLSFQSPTLLFPEPSESLPMQWDCIVSFATWYTFFFLSWSLSSWN